MSLMLVGTQDRDRITRMPQNRCNGTHCRCGPLSVTDASFLLLHVLGSVCLMHVVEQRASRVSDGPRRGLGRLAFRLLPWNDTSRGHVRHMDHCVVTNVPCTACGCWYRRMATDACRSRGSLVMLQLVCNQHDSRLHRRCRDCRAKTRERGRSEQDMLFILTVNAPHTTYLAE